MSTERWPIRLLAAQLRRPSGPAGLLVARRLNRNNRAMVLTAIDASGAAPGKHVVDVGFGGASSLALLVDRVSPGGQVSGVEASPTMVARARVLLRRPIARGVVRVEPGVATALPLADGAVDAVIMVNTVYFLTDLEAAFRECTRTLRRSGRLVVCFGDPVEMAALPVTAYGFVLRPVAEVQEGITAAGLTLDGHQRAGQPPSSFHVLTAHRP